jgi:hypothetical protein
MIKIGSTMELNEKFFPKEYVHNNNGLLIDV